MKTIPVADDDEHIRLFLETELIVEGYEVILANNGLAALEKIKEGAPDPVILDLRMPDIHDLKILKTIREENKDLPIILCTVYKKAQDNSTIRASGVAGYLIKPFGINHPKALIKKSFKK